MARTTTPAIIVSPKRQLTRQGIERALARLQERIDELQTFDVRTLVKGNSPDLVALTAAIKDTLERCFGENTSAYNRFKGAANLRYVSVAFNYDGHDRTDYVGYTQKNIVTAIALLKEAQRVLGEDLADHEHEAESELSATVETVTPALSHRVFVVHGHDEAALQGLARLLEKLGLEAIILKEQPDQGRTIIEKFEDEAADVGFAVVLLTPDDLGGSVKAETPDARARQNVIFELGYFAAKLGRGRVCLLRKGQVEIPSDLYGVIYSEMDPADGWKAKLVGELKAAKLDFDANRFWQ